VEPAFSSQSHHRGRLPLFIGNFVKDRQFQVRLGTHLSALFDQEMGVPQGRFLSVTLFALKINSIVTAICPNSECSLYVDDFLICYRSKHIHIIERHLQCCLNKLHYWIPTDFVSQLLCSLLSSTKTTS